MSDETVGEPSGETESAGTEAGEVVAGQAQAAGPAAAEPEGQGAGAAAPGRPNVRKVREGLVVSISMDKTAVVASVDRVRHRRYVKTVQRTKRLYAHDPNNETRLGDRVRIAETRPLSKLKRWRVVEILERAK